MTLNKRSLRYTLIASAVFTVAACSSSEQVLEPIKKSTPSATVSSRATESASKTLSDYNSYQYALDAA